ncbi:hypothetical protein ACFLS5_01505 [Candidatus Bipolaricaulota bacterium]
MKRRPIRYVVALVLALGAVSGHVQGEDLCLNAAYGAATAATLADTVLVGLIDAMHTLTATAELRTGEWETMRTLIGQFEQSTLLSYNAWFLLPDGTYYKVATGLATANLSDRGYFAPVMAGETTVGDLVISRSTGRKSMILTAPIERDGVVIGALGVTLYLDDFSWLLADKLNLPFGVGFYATNKEGLMAVHSDPSLLMEHQSLCAINLAQAGFQISEFLGWTFVLGVSATGP